MSDAQDMYEHAMRQTGIDDPAEALDSLIGSYSREESYDSDYDDYDEDEIEYDIGDTVRLQSGGPLMTIHEILSDKLMCRWFDKDSHLQKDIFHRDEIYYEIKETTPNIPSYSDDTITRTPIPDIEINEDEIPF